MAERRASRSETQPFSAAQETPRRRARVLRYARIENRPST
jgi:hypothetical protein